MRKKPAYNAHIAKIAALPRVDRFCVFSQSLLTLIKCWNAATSAICRNVACNGGQNVWQSIVFGETGKICPSKIFWFFCLQLWKNSGKTC